MPTQRVIWKTCQITSRERQPTCTNIHGIIRQVYSILACISAAMADNRSLFHQASWPLLLVLALAMLLGAAFAVLQWLPEDGEALLPTMPPAPNDRAVVPGSRVGFIRLGMSIDTVEQTLGQAVVRPYEDYALYLFESYGLHLAVHKGIVRSILVLNPSFATADGVKVGEDAGQAVRAFGDEYELSGDQDARYTLHYWKRGIQFDVNKHRITSILINLRVYEAWPKSP